MKKEIMFFLIKNFGHKEEYDIIEKERDIHKAYQIKYARDDMLRVLIFKGVRAVKSYVMRMIDEKKNTPAYVDGAFVKDEYARELVKAFAKKYFKIGR